MFSRLLLNQNGSALIQVLITTALVGMIGFSVVNWDDNQQKVNKQKNVIFAAKIIKNKLVNAVISPQSWELTQQANNGLFTSFANSNAGANSSSSSSSSGSLLNSKLDLRLVGSNSSFYDSKNPKSGFDLSGNPCDVSSNPFSKNEGSDTCPFHYDVSLKERKLINGVWVDTVQFELTFMPKSETYIFNGKKPEFNFSLIRNFSSSSVESICIALKSTFDAESAGCVVKLTQKVNCGDSSALRGPSSESGTAQCESFNLALSCPSGKTVKGFQSDGSPICSGVPGFKGQAVYVQ